ncbi:MAG: hypothetical protein K8I60_13695 [Anaerolineae bacterium]|nr:hypothetical protein [Anaerolineae bacterium]
MREHFSPDDLSKWLEYEPYLFISIIVNEIRQESLFIRGHAEIIHSDENAKEIKLAGLENVNTEEKTIRDLTTNILARLENIQDILNIAGMYSHEKLKRE